MKSPIAIAVLSTVLAMISCSSSLKINDTQITTNPVSNPNTTVELLPLMSSGYNENTLEDDSFNNNSTIISAFGSSSSSSSSSSSRRPFFEPLTNSHSAFIIPHEIGPSRWSC
ncbi:hypothetical protein BGZ92_008454, partial [Podila epicladia]